MEKFMTLLQEKLTPIANFCGTERHFASMQKGFMSAISFILVSAVFMILANPPVTADLVAQGGFWSVLALGSILPRPISSRCSFPST